MFIANRIFKRSRLTHLGLSLLLLVFIAPLTAQEYAFIYIDGNSGTNSVGTSWTNVGAGDVTDFTESTSSTNWSYSGNVLTAANNTSVEGNYCIKYSLSFNADIADWSVGVSIDGAAPAEPVFVRSISNDRKDAGNVSGIFMMSISQDQTVELVVKSSAAAKDFTPIYSQLSLCPAAHNSENYYAGMHIDATTTYTNLQTSFSKMTGFSAVSEINGWTFETSDLTAGASAAGIYYMSYSVSFTGSGGESSPIEYTFDLVKNSTNGLTHILTNRSTSALDIGNVSAGGLVSISSGDIISLDAKASLNNNDLTIEKATLSMFKLGDTTPNGIAGMKITSDQTVTISAQDTWTTVGTYSLISSNLWGLSSNVFTLNSTNAYGYYFLEYSTSLTTANTLGDDIELGVFVGSTLNKELTTSRRLSSNTDIGVVCGVGLFRVDGPDSTVTLKIRNTSSSNNLTIKKSMVGFSQIRYVYSDTPLPISLNSFDVEQHGQIVKLSWQTASEIDNARFLIYRDDEVIASIKGAGTTTEPHYYSFTDNYVVPGKTYTYVLADVSYSNVEVKHKNKAISLTVREGNVSKDYQIGKAYPNPFNPSTVIPVNLAREAQVNAEMYDLAGHKIKSLFDGAMNAGSHKLQVNGGDLSTGVYLVHIRIEGLSTIQKISLMK